MDDEQRLVKKRPSSTVFRFGGGERLQSNGRVTFPCHLAGKSCEITTDVVQSDIPLLLSKDAMKKAEMKLDLVHDRAEIFGKDVELQSTSSGHYCVPLKEVWLSVNDGVCCVVLCSITACYPVSKIWDGLLGSSKITNRGSRPNAQAN